MNAEETSIITQSAKAEENRAGIIKCKFLVAGNYLKLAELLTENHREGLFKLLGCDSWEEFLGQPEIGIHRSTAYNLMGIWKVFKERMGLDDHTLLDIDYTKLTKLLKISNVVEKDREEWLGKAKSLSVSDLVCEINGVSGIKSIPPPKSPAPPSSRKDECAICGNSDWEKSHFPITRGAGGDVANEWWIPMCRACHADFHHRPKEFMWEFKRRWASWFYSNINRGE